MLPALLIIVLIALAGAGLLVSGVYVLLGLGYALCLSGILLIAASAILRSGLTADG